MTSVAPEAQKSHRPRGVEQQSGNYRFKYATDDFWARQELEPLKSSCLLCGEKFAGTVAEGIAWHAAHRKKLHPKAKDRGQQVRQRAEREAPRTLGTRRKGSEV